MRTVNRLTAARLRTLTEPGKYADGDGLFLQVTRGADDTPRHSWTFRYRQFGRAHELGMGTLRDFNITEARERAHKLRQALRDGVDLLARQLARKQPKPSAVPTFAECCARYIAAHRAGWRSAKHAEQWAATLATYCEPIAKTPVDRVNTAAVLSCVEPHWTAKAETMTRVRQRIESVLDYATARGLRSGDNPARWKGHLSNLLPKRSKVAAVQHRAALPYADAPDFITALRKREGFAPRALELQILTATRPGETCGACWDEFDLDAAAWIIPADRMKAGKEHRVPLSSQAVRLLRAVPVTRSPFVFPGLRPAKPMTTAAPMKLLKELRPGMTCHGFRSTFRDWAGETTHHPREVIEHAMAHRLKDAAEAAYQRGDLLRKRAALMQDWADYLDGHGRHAKA